MKNIQNILKIEKDNKILLRSVNSVMNYFPCTDFKIIRNLNNEKIEVPIEMPKHRCIVETNDSPNLDLLTIGDPYTIFSILPFKQHKNTTILKKHITSSLKEVDGNYLTYRPILDMYLINYQFNDSGKYKWKLEFEEV